MGIGQNVLMFLTFRWLPSSQSWPNSVVPPAICLFQQPRMTARKSQQLSAGWPKGRSSSSTSESTLSLPHCPPSAREVKQPSDRAGAGEELLQSQSILPVPRRSFPATPQLYPPCRLLPPQAQSSSLIHLTGSCCFYWPATCTRKQNGLQSQMTLTSLGQRIVRTYSIYSIHYKFHLHHRQRAPVVRTPASCFFVGLANLHLFDANCGPLCRYTNPTRALGSLEGTPLVSCFLEQQFDN